MDFQPRQQEALTSEETEMEVPAEEEELPGAVGEAVGDEGASGDEDSSGDDRAEEARDMWAAILHVGTERQAAADLSSADLEAQTGGRRDDWIFDDLEWWEQSRGHYRPEVVDFLERQIGQSLDEPCTDEEWWAHYRRLRNNASFLLEIILDPRMAETREELRGIWLRRDEE